MNITASFQTANRILLREGILNDLGEHLDMFDDVKQVLIVTADFMKDLDFMKSLENQLTKKDITYNIFDKVEAEPTIDHITSVTKELDNVNYDLIIGIGGGSVLDVTKLLSVLMKGNVELKNLVEGEKIKSKGIPMVLIPTTAGTGSEVTPNAIVTLPKEELKVGVVSSYLLPDLVLLDPNLTISLPPHITAATGMDAFTHSFESYISNKANPLSDMFAMESMRLISKSILKAYHNGGDIEARKDMLLASTYGGMALTSAGTAAVHALAYPLGGKFNISHGEANSMLLPHVTRENLDTIEERMSVIAREIGLTNDRNIEQAEAAQLLIDEMVNWTKELNIPQDLRKFGVTDDDVHTLATAASKVKRLMDNNPKVLSIDVIESIYKKML
ncbi:alcohol dehydrogenase [Salipaludibacillus neizhouensis]|uniref:Alcohol dehydrogenase n=1 Tax=Salipaludibacillus neizhouensis TaxID=885475 RepID=A0A3A9K9A4_9BACI|nr:iron-containing alcohol dehydrogenase [Salipaludibacillus neizhouensis]RKL68108.1 alcohol dehydrogenase [Salipaludibacillus neizhouensis]